MMKVQIGNTVRDATPEELAAYQARNDKAVAVEQAAAPERARAAAIDSAIAGDTTLAQLKAMTTDEFDTWWGANVTNLAQANTVLKRLARVVIRRLL